MDHLALYLPWAIAAILHVEHGRMWLRLVMITDASRDSADLLSAMSGQVGFAAAASARLVVFSAIIGWPAYMAYGWIVARCSRG